MSLMVLFRSRLEWCNFTCHYCPWNAEKTSVTSADFQQDEARIFLVIDQVGRLTQEVEFFITPKAEYLVLAYWREAVRRLLKMEQVSRVTVQTNLSFDLPSFLDQINAEKLALWTTYHPTEVSDRQQELLLQQWDLLITRQVPFSVGIVGTRANLSVLESLRARLDRRVYLWVNAYKREANYYKAEEVAFIRSIDPLFDLNNQHFPSLAKPCNAGYNAVYLDDVGDIRRCFFVGQVIGNIFRDGWLTQENAQLCPVSTCDCYVGQMHIPELAFRQIYGRNLAVRIPASWPNRTTEWVALPVSSQRQPEPRRVSLPMQIEH